MCWMGKHEKVSQQKILNDSAQYYASLCLHSDSLTHHSLQLLCLLESLGRHFYQKLQSVLSVYLLGCQKLSICSIIIGQPLQAASHHLLSVSST